MLWKGLRCDVLSPLPVHQLKEVCLCVFNVRWSDWSVGCQVTLDWAVTGGRESYSDPSHITLQPWNLPQYWTRPFIVCQRSLYQDFAFLLNGSNTIVWTVSQHLVSQTTTCQIYSTPATHNECWAQWVNRGGHVRCSQHIGKVSEHEKDNCIAFDKRPSMCWVMKQMWDEEISLTTLHNANCLIYQQIQTLWCETFYVFSLFSPQWSMIYIVGERNREVCCLVSQAEMMDWVKQLLLLESH